MYRKNELLNPKPINEKKEITLPEKQGDSDFEPDWNFGEEDQNTQSVEDITKDNKSFVVYSDIKKFIEKIDKLYALGKKIENEQTENVYDISSVKLYEILQYTSFIAMKIREAVDYNTRFFSYNERKKVFKRYVNALPITVSQPENAILRVKIYPLIRDSYKGAYNVYWDVKDAIKAYSYDNKIERITSGKLLLIYKKYGPANARLCSYDNDNWEMKRVTNAISESINYPDTAKNFSFLYTAVEAEENYVEATLIRMENIDFFTKYLAENQMKI